ncbi:MAG: hypothetical protein AAGC43_04220 [Bacteroidota bacterium]
MPTFLKDIIQWLLQKLTLRNSVKSKLIQDISLLTLVFIIFYLPIVKAKACANSKKTVCPLGERSLDANSFSSNVVVLNLVANSYVKEYDPEFIWKHIVSDMLIPSTAYNSEEHVSQIEDLDYSKSTKRIRLGNIHPSKLYKGNLQYIDAAQDDETEIAHQSSFNENVLNIKNKSECIIQTPMSMIVINLSGIENVYGLGLIF